MTTRQRLIMRIFAGLLWSAALLEVACIAVLAYRAGYPLESVIWRVCGTLVALAFLFIFALLCWR